jgi:hypothetical protein
MGYRPRARSRRRALLGPHRRGHASRLALAGLPALATDPVDVHRSVGLQMLTQPPAELRAEERVVRLHDRRLRPTRGAGFGLKHRVTRRIAHEQRTANHAQRHSTCDARMAPTGRNDDRTSAGWYFCCTVDRHDAQEDARSIDPPRDDEEEDRSQAGARPLEQARHRDERRADGRVGDLQERRSDENRDVAQEVRGGEPTTKVEPVPFGDVAAHVLFESRRSEPGGVREGDPRKGKGGASASLRP